MKIFFMFFLAIILSACGSSDEKFLGFWKQDSNRFQYLKIEKNGEGHLLTIYSNSFVDGSIDLKEYQVTIKDNTLTVASLTSGVYKESDNTLVLGGKQTFIKVDDVEARRVIEAKEQEKVKAEATCKALQEEVDLKNQELKGKDNDGWNTYVKTLKKRKPKNCMLRNTSMVW